MSLSTKNLGWAVGFGGEAPLLSGIIKVETPALPPDNQLLTPEDFENLEDSGFGPYNLLNPNFELGAFNDENEINGAQKKLPFNIDIDWINGSLAQSIGESSQGIGVVSIDWIDNERSIFTPLDLYQYYTEIDPFTGDYVNDFFGIVFWDLPGDLTPIGPIESARFLTLDPQFDTPRIFSKVPDTSTVQASSEVIAVNLIGNKEYRENGSPALATTLFDENGLQIFKVDFEIDSLAANPFPIPQFQPSIDPEIIRAIPGLTAASSIFEQETEIFEKPTNRRLARRFRGVKRSSVKWEGTDGENSFLKVKTNINTKKSADDKNFVAAIWQTNNAENIESSPINISAIFSKQFTAQGRSNLLLSFNNLAISGLLAGDESGTEYYAGIIDPESGKVIAETKVKNFGRALSRRTTNKLERLGYIQPDLNDELPDLFPFTVEPNNPSSAPERPTTPAADVGFTAEEPGPGPDSVPPGMPGGSIPGGGGTDPNDPGSSVPGGGGSPNPNPDGSIPGGGGTDPNDPGSSVPGTNPGGSAPSIPNTFEKVFNNLRELQERSDSLKTDWESRKLFEFSPNVLEEYQPKAEELNNSLWGSENLLSKFNQSSLLENYDQKNTNWFID
jgi:hypothetical protein